MQRVDFNILIVEAGSDRFILQVTDRDKFNAFAKEMRSVYNTAYENSKGINIREKGMDALKAVLNHSDSGLTGYRSTNIYKLDFVEIR
jgi:hypothetical protein